MIHALAPKAHRLRLLGVLPVLLSLGLLSMAHAAHPPLRVPPAADVPQGEPAPKGFDLPPPEIKQEKQRRLQVTLIPLPHPGVDEATSVVILRDLAKALRRDQRLDMKDLDLRLSDFAQEVPLDQVELARTSYQKGRESMEKLELDAAIPQLEDAVDQLVAVLPYIKKQELADAMLALAVAHFQKGNRRACNGALIRLLTWRPDYQVEPQAFPEQILAPLEEARRAVNRGARSQVHVVSEPAGAQVFVDGQYAGVTPLDTEDLLVGQHYLTFKKIGFKKGLRLVDVSARSKATVQAKLAPSEKFLLVRQAIEKLEKKMGAPRLEPVLDNLKETLYLDHGVFLSLVPYAGPVTGTAADQTSTRVLATLYLYDLRNRSLLKKAIAVIPAVDDLDEKMGQLGKQLYGGLDLFGTARPWDPPPPPRVVRTPIYKRWWFITAGAVLAGSVAAVALGLSLTRTPGCPDGHLCAALQY